MQNQSEFAGKVVVITGGAGGIGKATALAFAEQGAHVAIADLQARAGEALCDELQAMGMKSLFYKMDVSSESDNEKLMDLAVSELGGLDILVAVAGMGNSDKKAVDIAPEELNLVNLPLESWQRVLDVNLTGLMLANRAAARRMIAAEKGGCIVNMSSGASLLPIPGASNYAASKAGVNMLTKVLALELVNYNIRVNAVCPGNVETPLLMSRFDDAEQASAAVAYAPMGRLGRPEEIADTILFLASEKSSFYTGEILKPAGGVFLG